MAIFDDPRGELNRLQKQLLAEEHTSPEENPDFEEDTAPAAPLPRPKPSRKLALIVLAELLGISLIAAYWLRVIL